MAAPLPLETSDSHSTVELVCLNPEDIEQLWPLVRGYVRKVVRLTPKLEEIDVLKLVQEEYWQLWIAWDVDRGDALAAMTTELTNYESGWRTVRINLLGGIEMDRWKHLVSEIEDWARSEGCDAVEICGRKGWGTVFPEYELIEHTFSKELRHDQRWK